MVNCKHDKGFYVKVRGSVVDYYTSEGKFEEQSEFTPDRGTYTDRSICYCSVCHNIIGRWKERRNNAVN